MELQRPRRRCDELGHEPLCDRIRRGVLGETHSNARGGHVTAYGARVDAEAARRFGQGALEDVAQHKRAEVGAPERVPANEVTKSRREDAAAAHRFADRGRGLAIDLTDAKERRDLRGRESARFLEARDEPAHDNVVGDRRARTDARYRRRRRERRRQRATQTVEIREFHDLDDGGIAQEKPRDRSIALRDDDDGDGMLTGELDLDPHTERRDAGIRDEHRRARDMRSVDLVDRARVEVRRRYRVSDAVRQIRAQAGSLSDLREELVEELRARPILESCQCSRDVRLANRGESLVRFVHGPLMMLGASSCTRRIRRMPEQRVAEHLKRLPLFSRLPDSELGELAERVRTKSFKRGEMIFRKDDPGTHLYMVLDGAVKIALPGEFGQEALVAIMRPGEFFGELALFDRSPRSASATALEDTRAALLAGDDFLAYLESHPASFRVVLETLARTIRRLSDRVEDLIFLDVPSRVAKYLLDLVRSSGDGNELTLTQDELAAFIGASRVSVNRVLGDLERRDIISIRRRRIAIKDADRLAKEVRF
jgi:CRP/FNR family transcriptional regulator, cyclic AMP receptor protein